MLAFSLAPCIYRVRFGLASTNYTWLVTIGILNQLDYCCKVFTCLLVCDTVVLCIRLVFNVKELYVVSYNMFSKSVGLFCKVFNCC